MNVKQVAFVVGTAILFAILVGLAVDAFYTSPKYERFCNDTFQPYAVSPEKGIPAVNCSTTNFSDQNLVNGCFSANGIPRYKYDEKGCSLFESCDMCNKKFQDAQGMYNKNAFYMIFIIGIIAMVAGLIITEILGAGLMFGGILTSIYSIMRYFSELGKTARFLVVLAGFLIIVYVGRKKLNDSKEAKKIQKKKKR